MRGSAAFRTGVAPGGALAPGWVKNELWRKARAVPSLDLRFADNKSLVDATTGASLVTFTRASSGTFVGSDGVLRSAVTNLVLWSEDFSNVAWVANTATVTTNTQTAPNGTLTADTFSPTSGTGSLHQIITCLASTAYTWSFYIKLGTMAAADFRFAVRDDSNGAFIAIDIAPNVTPVTTEWRRVTYTFTTPAGCVLVRPYLYRFTPATYGTTVHFWGAQLEQSATVGEYIPTTSAINSAPRFDHNPTTGESLGLLVEEARTNLIVGSELFTGGGWSGPGSSTIASTTATTAPDGSNNAIKFAENTVASQFHFINYSVTKAASAIQYTYSVYAKAAGRELAFSVANANGGFVTRFNLANGTITLAAAGYGIGFTAQASTITPVGNGWYRCSLTGTTDATTSVATQFSTYNTALATGVYTGDGTSGFFLWGAQLEAGAFPTSYIPTTTATVTRAADVASITGSNFSSWYNQTEGTVFADVSVLSTADTNQSISFSDGTLNNRFELRPVGVADQVRSSCTVGNINQYDNNFSLTSLRRSVVLGIKPGNTRIQSGSAGVTCGSFAAMPVVDRLHLHIPTFANGEITGTIKRLTYWPTRLSNTTLQQITQP